MISLSKSSIFSFGSRWWSGSRYSVADANTVHRQIAEVVHDAAVTARGAGLGAFAGTAIDRMHFVAVAFHVQSVEIVLVVEAFFVIIKIFLTVKAVLFVERLVPVELGLILALAHLIVQLIILDVNVSIQIDYRRTVHRRLSDLAHLVHLIQLVHLI